MLNKENEMFALLHQNMPLEEINEILFNWNESELNKDATEILIYVDSRADGPRTGGADIVDKKEFVEWLLSDAPFNPEIYGEDIGEDSHWKGLIEKARSIVNS